MPPIRESRTRTIIQPNSSVGIVRQVISSLNLGQHQLNGQSASASSRLQSEKEELLHQHQSFGRQHQVSEEELLRAQNVLDGELKSDRANIPSGEGTRVQLRTREEEKIIDGKCLKIGGKKEANRGTMFRNSMHIIHGGPRRIVQK